MKVVDLLDHGRCDLCGDYWQVAKIRSKGVIQHVCWTCAYKIHKAFDSFYRTTLKKYERSPSD